MPSPIEFDVIWNEDYRRYVGAVVQPLCIGGLGDSNSNTENMNDSVNDSTRMGVRVVVVDRSGFGDWWLVRRIDDHQIGVREIVL